MTTTSKSGAMIISLDDGNDTGRESVGQQIIEKIKAYIQLHQSAVHQNY
jgi:hypothetical protein